MLDVLVNNVEIVSIISLVYYMFPRLYLCVCVCVCALCMTREHACIHMCVSITK